MATEGGPMNIATISAGFEKGDFLVREEQGNRVYFDFFEEVGSCARCEVYYVLLLFLSAARGGFPASVFRVFSGVIFDSCAVFCSRWSIYPFSGFSPFSGIQLHFEQGIRSHVTRG